MQSKSLFFEKLHDENSRLNEIGSMISPDPKGIMLFVMDAGKEYTSRELYLTTKKFIKESNANTDFFNTSSPKRYCEKSLCRSGAVQKTGQGKYFKTEMGAEIGDNSFAFALSAAVRLHMNDVNLPNSISAMVKTYNPSTRISHMFYVHNILKEMVRRDGMSTSRDLADAVHLRLNSLHLNTIVDPPKIIALIKRMDKDLRILDIADRDDKLMAPLDIYQKGVFWNKNIRKLILLNERGYIFWNEFFMQVGEACAESRTDLHGFGESAETLRLDENKPLLQEGIRTILASFEREREECIKIANRR